MSLKLKGNGLWESSRMMLPEHKEAIKLREGLYNRRKKPMLNEDNLEQLNHYIQESFENMQRITLQVFHPFEQISISGIIIGFDTVGRRIKIQCETIQWVKIVDILDAILD
ncbi:YolD-like family protein [Paenibacillus agilis]|uniref:YolD-like family protein n=1 Tax=Paenibacillus agilis TaxID=3020863 RepID=A0A559IDC2_9BACL|nr:YolD-like family protein [Paenibacillus agilis]TVX85530.1 YolD-like family protein [Paenibacillus agilis]